MPILCIYIIDVLTLICNYIVCPKTLSKNPLKILQKSFVISLTKNLLKILNNSKNSLTLPNTNQKT